MCSSLCFFLFFFFYFMLFLAQLGRYSAALGLSLAAESRGHPLSWRVAFSLQWLRSSQSTGAGCMHFSSGGSQALEHRLSSCGAWV